MIDALAKVAATFQNKQFEEAAIRGAHFILEHLIVSGQLLHRYREGEARFNAGLEDYAFFIKALITLFELGHGTHWLEKALSLSEKVERTFKSEAGAFYQSSPDPHLLVRKCEFYDGAEPSGNAIHCENLLRLYQLTQREQYLKQAEDVLKAAKTFIEAFPPGACYHLICLQRFLDVHAPMLLFALPEESKEKAEFQEALAKRFAPHASVAWKQGKDEEFARLLPFAVDQLPVGGESTLYVCRGQHCEPPIVGKEAILKYLHQL